ncbi:MAG: glycosyltransferase family 4 protein [Cyanomargarita calcarea GSE-NOS-MK-12-04C]|jgi:alpha-1,2-rhamnosyltransferase|uniref:Glycosyltransferase family 4 protein n=1 Tax=Cyanomargarita calcarea GSE-NOS-MK-12-04C TaxID=2839659 RepID=A0A951QLH7_9CYAN|nr:glycosyltransferase family 4 protein [Cyanomargarita calcarea GSE-NOS-MK-12-04C]
MRIFLDCTHTAKHTYKNTGIHRVVRELTSELVKLSSECSDLEVIPVMFDGYSMRRVVNLHQQIYTGSLEKKQYFYSLFKINRRFLNLLIKLKNKFINYISIVYLIENLNLFRAKIYHFNIDFEGIKLSQDDIYIIADANWDLPKSYYSFLQSLKNHQVIIGAICYDLIPIKFPEYCSKKFSEQFINFYNTYSELFDKVLCISHNSAKDYIDAQNQGIFSKNKNSIVSSFRLGCDFPNKDLINDEDNGFNNYQKEILSKRYILIVGSLTPHKNIKTIIAAFNLLLDKNYEDTHLVFAGNKGWDLETDRLIETHKMYEKVIHIFGSVTDSQLNILYNNCYCLVQASLYEGFGLPVVEALQYGKPVIASTGGSLPEVGGDFCMYFNPTQPIELYQSLKKLLASDIEYNHFIERIRNEYKAFSWQESAEQFLSRIRS